MISMINIFDEKQKSPEIEELEKEGFLCVDKDTTLKASDEMIRFNESVRLSDNGVVDEEHLSIHGLLSPMGVMHSCNFGDHNKLCISLGFNSLLEMEDKGWVSLASMKWKVEPKYLSKPLNRSQWSFIQDWFMKNGYGRNAFLDLQEASL